MKNRLTFTLIFTSAILANASESAAANKPATIKASEALKSLMVGQDELKKEIGDLKEIVTGLKKNQEENNEKINILMHEGSANANPLSQAPESSAHSSPLPRLSQESPPPTNQQGPSFQESAETPPQAYLTNPLPPLQNPESFNRQAFEQAAPSSQNQYYAQQQLVESSQQGMAPAS